VPTPLVERYFDAEGSDLVFRKSLRRTIIFGRHDLVADPPISRVDVLTCRNTLMYFTPPTQQHILRQLHFAVRPHGYLVLGRSEALATRNDLFTPVDLKRRVFRRVASPKEAAVSEHRETNRTASPSLPVADDASGLGGSVFEVSPIAQVVIDQDSTVVAINQQARQLFGSGTTSWCSRCCPTAARSRAR
jgi:two-component system CheB/CheR fusion protein